MKVSYEMPLWMKLIKTIKELEHQAMVENKPLCISYVHRYVNESYSSVHFGIKILERERYITRITRGRHSVITINNKGLLAYEHIKAIYELRQ